MKQIKTIGTKAQLAKALSLVAAICVLNISSSEAFQGSLGFNIGGGYANNPCSCYAPSSYGMYP